MGSRFRGKLTYANVTSSLALFLVLTGGLAFAALKNSVTTKQIKDGQVKTQDVGDGEIGFSDLDSNSVGSPKIINGSVLGPDLGADSVGAGAIAAGAVRAEEIGNASVGPDQLSDGAVGTPQIGAVPAVKVVASAQIPYADSTSAAIPFDSETAPAFDPFGMHDPAQPARLSAPVDGIYQVEALLRWQHDPDDDDVFRLSLRKTTGPTTIAFVSQRGDTGFSQDPTTLSIGSLVELDAGETVELVAVQDNFDNDPLNILTSSGMPYMSMHWVSPG
jgi:hypothetical protein